VAIMIKKVTRIFENCFCCPFCRDAHIKEVTGYYVRYFCQKSESRVIDKIKTFPDWCPLREETVIDFTKLVLC
jgi:hypothetical protein